MQKTIIFCAFLATSFAAPGYYYDVDYHVPVKSTITTSSQSVDHGSTHVLHAAIPVGKSTVVKSQTVEGSHVLETVPIAKTTVTKSNQVVNHGGTAVVHAPVLSTYHAPVVSTYHAPLVSYHAPLVSYHAPVSYTGDSAVSHHSSTVHETVPVVNHLPLYTLH